MDDLSDIDEEITPERAAHDAVEATIDDLQDFEVFGIEPIDPEVDDLSDIDEEITPERAAHDAVEATIDDLQDFFMSMGMPSTLGELGIAEDDIDQMICGLRVKRGVSLVWFLKLTLDDAREI